MFKEKLAAKAAVVAGVFLPVLAQAQADPIATQIQNKVTESMTAGEALAGAIVLGLFAIFAVKLLWRAK